MMTAHETEKLTLERRLRMYQARDAIINRLNPEAHQLIDLDIFLRAAASELGKLMEVDRCNFLIRSPSGELRIDYEYRADESIPSMLGMKIPTDLQALNGKLDIRHSIAINDTAALTLDPIIGRIVEMTATRSLLIVPVVLKSEVLGLIGLQYCKQPHSWLPEEISFIESIARQVAIGYAYTKLYSEKEKEANINRVLLEIANDINTSGDFLDVTASVIDKAVELIGADLGCLAVLDATGKHLHFDLVRGRGRDALRIEPLDVEEHPLIRLAFEARKPLSLASSEANELADFFLRKLFSDASSALIVPIIIRDRAFGLLNLVWVKGPRRFTRYEVELVAGIANQIAITLEKDQLSAEVVRLRQQLHGTRGSEPIIGVSEKIKKCIEMAMHVADSPTTVLLQGESGTGKELIADLIHYNSPRANKPFIKINCGALPETLLETELFGHERGAFTDARSRRIGKFEEANGGTLFLDEVGEMSPSAQVKLLRVLQDGEFTRVGGNQVIKTDVRIIAATNVELMKAVEAGKFRLDLFYRLNVYPIHIPPLRERPEDIRPLVIHFIKLYQKKSGKRITGITERALELLERYDWPGNVRELENAIERAVILAAGRMITVNDLPEAIRGRHQEVSPTAASLDVGAPVEEVERRVLLESLMPSLGHCREYVYPLALHFLDLYRKKLGRPVTGLSEQAWEALRYYDWPGGLRELEAVIERAVAAATGSMITVSDLPETIRRVSAEASRTTLEVEIGVPLREVERQVILHALAATGGDKAKAARLLRISRKTLYRKLERYGALGPRSSRSPSR